MRIVVTSDSHRNTRNLYEIIEKHKESTDLFINLGDGEDDVDSALLLYPTIKLERVCGNCDWGSALPRRYLPFRSHAYPIHRIQRRNLFYESGCSI